MEEERTKAEEEIMEKGVIGREGVNEGARREWGMEVMGERNQNGLWQKGSKKDRTKCG